MVAFISGHGDLTNEEFIEHYLFKLIKAVKENHSFVVGDFRGADTICQSFLSAITNKVTVYHMFDKPRNTHENFSTVGGFQTDEARDCAMTLASDYDIAWVRPGRDRSGTTKNIDRRIKKNELKHNDSDINEDINIKEFIEDLHIQSFIPKNIDINKTFGFWHFKDVKHCFVDTLEDCTKEYKKGII